MSEMVLASPEEQLKLVEKRRKTYQRVKPTDDELADELAVQLGGSYAYFRSAWHEYRAGCWVAHKNINGELRRFMIDQKVHGIKPTKAKAGSIEWFLQAQLELEDEMQIDNYPQYLNVRNGLLNLDTLELEPHSRDIFFTAQLDFDYDPEAECPNFEHFIKTSLVMPDGSSDGELAWLLLEALGYTLTADTSKRVSFWLVGESASGKSVLLNLIRELLGDMHVTLDLNQLATNRFLLSKVAGKRAITFPEADVGAVLADGIYKVLVGGSDEIQADVKNRDPISFIPQAKVWWAMNGLPRVLDRSDAVFNRVKIFPFIRTVPTGQRDYMLGHKLHNERSGILNLALLGLRRLRKYGEFTQATAAAEAHQRFVLDNDTERVFANEKLIRGAEHEMQAQQLYNVYRSWCADNGFKPKSKTQVSKDWERLGFEKTRKSDGRYYRGVKLNGDEIF